MLNRENFQEKAKEIHGDKYDYSKVEYINTKTKVCIICPVHGEFWQTPDKHINRKHGCQKCAKNCKQTLEQFVEKAKEIHGDKYDYSKVEYINTDTKVCIICPEHGEFWQTPHMHLKKQGCPKCYGNIRKTTKEFVSKAKEIHGEKYDYSKTHYINAFTKVIITCPEHGEFEQIARVHLYGHGCPKCVGKKKYNKDYFLEKAKEIHGSKYDYSLLKEEDFINNRNKVQIICKKHGTFEQAIDNHINQKHGCPKCSRSKLEENVSKFLDKNRERYTC